MTAQCPACGAVSAPGKRFCGDCGAPLALSCPSCGTSNPPGKRFCGDCGSALTPTTAPPSGHAAPPARLPALQDQFTAIEQALPPAVRPQIFTQEEGENRLLTILFADLSGSTAAVGALAPEDAATLLQGVLQAMVDAIVAHGGRINQVLGDAVLAFFGTPVAHENDPERAIRAALQLREAVQGRGLNVTVGINSGEVYLGERGRGPQQDIRAVGPAIHLAARLQQRAQPGQILVGASVYGPTRRAFEFVEHTVEAKGFAGPVAAYEVLRPLPRAEKVRGIEGLHAALVGREEELGKLTGALEAVRAGQGQIVTLIGEAGMGKSRLIAELKELALTPAADRTQPLWLEGRCLDIGMAVSYWPFLDLLRAYVGFLEEDDERTRGERVVAALQELVTHEALTPERSREMLPLLGQLLAARFGSALDERLHGASPEQIKHQTFLTLRDLCVALTKRQPLVLVLEDLHWADSLSLDLVSLLMEALVLGPLFLLCIYRPEREHKCWHLGAIAARKCPERHTELTLRELTPAQSRHLVESLLHIEALPVGVKERILTRTQGNPFFVEEVVRSLIDTGLVYHDGMVWRAHEEIAEMAVPESVQGVILSRVDRLDREAKHVLQSAAVIGRLFRRRLLGQLARQETELDRALAELEDRQLIYAERAIPEEEYSFEHVLTQETVYQNILRRQRVVFHRQVAEGLERLYAESLEEYYEQLAYHYEQADVQEKALEYLERAGDKAQAQYANATAEGYFRDLVERLETLGRALDAARVREKLGAVLNTVGQYDAALAVLGQAEEAYRALDDRERVAGTLAEIGHIYGLSQRESEGVARLQASLPDLEASGPAHGVAALYVALAELFWRISRTEEGLAAAARAAAFARATGDQRLLGRAEERRASLLWTMVGRREEALQAAGEACRAAEASGDLETLTFALQDMAAIHMDWGEFEPAQGYLERALEVAERQGNPLQIYGVMYLRAGVSVLRGEWDQARSGLQRGEAIRRQAGIDPHPLLLMAPAELALAEGALEELFRLLDDYVSRLERSGSLDMLRWVQRYLAKRDLLEGRPEAARARLVPLLDRPGLQELFVNQLLPVLAWAHLAAGDAVQAAEVVAQALARMRPENLRVFLVEALQVQAMVAIQQERWEEATSALEEGIALARAMPYPYAEGRLLHTYGQMHLQKGEPDQAHERLEAAQAIFGRLGARNDAERVAQAMADLSPSA